MMDDFTQEGFDEVKDWCKDIATQVSHYPYCDRHDTIAIVQ